MNIFKIHFRKVGKNIITSFGNVTTRDKVYLEKSN